MLEDRPAHYVRLATVGDLTTARVLAARLEAEGIEVRIHSEALGPYPVTVGHLAETELWIMQDRIDEAAAILLDAEVNVALAPADPEQVQPRRGMPIEFRFAALVLGVVIASLWVLRLIRMF